MEQRQLSVDIGRMLEDELAWLCNFQPSGKRLADISTDDYLLTGTAFMNYAKYLGCVVSL